MQFDKNSDLIHNICLVQIKSIDDTVDLSTLTSIYHSPSSINLTKNSNNTPNGILHKKNLNLFYPGISNDVFDRFNELVRGAYQVYIKTDNNDIYEVASTFFPMDCKTNYNITNGHSITFESSSPIPIKYIDNQPGEGINISGFDYELDFYLS